MLNTVYKRCLRFQKCCLQPGKSMWLNPDTILGFDFKMPQKNSPIVHNAILDWTHL